MTTSEGLLDAGHTAADGTSAGEGLFGAGAAPGWERAGARAVATAKAPAGQPIQQALDQQAAKGVGRHTFQTSLRKPKRVERMRNVSRNNGGPGIEASPVWSRRSGNRGADNAAGR